jgi:hypothetical protein
MTLRIEWSEGQMRLSGELRFEHLDQVQAELERHGSTIALDLEELDLVDVEAIRFFNACEAKGISVSHCSPYIRAWMSREGERPAARRRKRRKEK